MEKKKKQITQKKSCKEGKKQRAQAKAGKENKTGFPVYLAVLLIVFGIAAGLAINSLFLPKAAQLPGGSVNKGTFDEQAVELKVFFNSDCKICFNASVLEAYLSQRNVKYSVERLDVQEKENGVLAGMYGIKSFPSVLLNWKQLKLTDPKAYAAINQISTANGDYFVIAEADIAREAQQFAPIMFMDPQFKERCGVKNGTVRIDEFNDYFSKYSFESQGIIEQIKKDFNENIEYNYHSFPIVEQSEKTAIATECARNQGKLEEYKKALFMALFEKSIDITDSNALKTKAIEIKMPDQAAFEKCLDENQTKATVENDHNAARQYKLFALPSAVIDCIYTTIETTDLKKQICTVHPDFNACKKE